MKYVTGSCSPQELQKKNDKNDTLAHCGIDSCMGFWGSSLCLHFSFSKCCLNFMWLTFSPQALECIFVLVFSRKFRLRELGFKKITLWDPLYLIFAVSCLVSIDKRTTLTCKPHDGMILSLTLLLQIQVLLVPVHHIPQLLWGCSYMPDSYGGGPF